jgi:hypothetical protein
MVFASVEWWIIVVISLVLFGVILTLAAFIASASTAPVAKTSADKSRGVVRLRFRNPAYVPLVFPLIETKGIA